VASANLSVPLYCVILRKGYGLGAQAMCGGSTQQAFFTVGWPTAELGPMGLEGAVELGFRKELEATTSTQERHALFQQLVGRMYEKGKAVSVASAFEIDAVIDPIDTRAWLLRGLRAAGRTRRPSRRYVDVW
jgi:acetyl-CoA carboxylase carboxyltransferase component